MFLHFFLGGGRVETFLPFHILGGLRWGFQWIRVIVWCSYSFLINLMVEVGFSPVNRRTPQSKHWLQ